MRAVAGAGDAVMHDRAVRSRAGDGRERNVLEQAGVAAEAFQRLDRVDLGELAGRRLALEPGEEARHGHAVALVGGAAAGDLGVVLHRLHQRDRIGPAHRLAAAVRDDAGERVGGARLVEPHGLALELREIARKLAGARTSANLLQRVAHVVVELGAVDIERRPALARDERKGERQRRMRHVGAADVEGPGDVLRVRHHQRIGAQLGELGVHALELVGGAFAGELDVAQAHRAGGRRRPVASTAHRSDCRRPPPVRRRPWRRPCAASRRCRPCAARDRSRAWRRS